MRIRTGWIPNCSAGAINLMIDRMTALKEFIRLADNNVDIEVYQKRNEENKKPGKTLLKTRIHNLEEVKEILARFPDADMMLHFSAGGMVLKENGWVSLGMNGVYSKMDFFLYWAPLVQHARQIEFSYYGECDDELPWEIKTPEEVKAFYTKFITIDPVEMHRKQVEYWENL